MKFYSNIIVLSISVEYFYNYVSSQSFFYEKLHNFGRGNRIIENYKRLGSNWLKHRQEYPDPLPSKKPSVNLSPYHNIYQGRRMANDTRVFRRRFEHAAKGSGHQIVCEGLFSCIITHLAIETTGGIPILLRGGVGHNNFVVVVRAKPNNELKGSVLAYCLKKPDNYYGVFKK